MTRNEKLVLVAVVAFLLLRRGGAGNSAPATSTSAPAQQDGPVTQPTGKVTNVTVTDQGSGASASANQKQLDDANAQAKDL